MYYVYLIRSKVKRIETYVGLTEDVKSRVVSHNEGANKHLWSDNSLNIGRDPE